jgi:hypothetical protein
MNTLYRILVILVVAAIIGGAIYMSVGGGSSSSQGAFQRSEGGQIRPEGGERDTGGGLPFGVAKTLAVVSLVGAAYMAGDRFFNRKRLKTVSV